MHLRFRAKFARGGLAFGFGDGDGLADRDVGELVDLAAGPADFDGVRFLGWAEAEGEDELAGGKIAGAAAEHLGLRCAAGSDLHNRTDAVAIGSRSHEFTRRLLFAGALPVASFKKR